MTRPDLSRWLLVAAAYAAVSLCGAKASHAQSAPAGLRQSASDQRQPPAAEGANGSFLTPKTAQSQNLAAAEQEDETSVYRHSPSVRAIGRWFHLDEEHASRLFEYLNFAVLFGAILFYLAKLLPRTFRQRRETIQHHLTEARTATEQANERLTAVEARLAHLDQEIASVRAQTERDSVGDEQRIKAQMEEERRRIVDSAEQEIAAAAAAARRELKRFAGELAVAQATRKIILSDSADRALIRSFARNLHAEDAASDRRGRQPGSGDAAREHQAGDLRRDSRNGGRS